MYLSKVFLPPRKLHNAYEWHRALWTLFPNVERGASSPFIYHIESLNLATGAQLLMQSSIQPAMRTKTAQVLASKAFPAKFLSDQRLFFQLLANPTKTITDQHNKSNKRNQGKCRVPLLKEDDQAQWLHRKLDGAASIVDLTIRNYPPVYFRKGSRSGKIVPATFEGVLDVQNADAMAVIWQNGIGPAKAFGCGLLLIRRA